jgi:hypothetical protein
MIEVLEPPLSILNFLEKVEELVIDNQRLADLRNVVG